MKVWLFPILFTLINSIKYTEKEKGQHLCETCKRNGCSLRNYNYPPSKMVKCVMYKEKEIE